MISILRVALLVGLSLGLASAQTPTLVKDINPPRGAASSHSYPRYFVALGDRVIFSAISGDMAHQPWISDGTEAGTTLLKQINPSGSSHAVHFVRFGDRVLFIARDLDGFGLWSTDGTTAGTVRLVVVAPLIGSLAGPIAVDGDRAVFYVTKPGGNELWLTDGTAAGTAPYTNIGSLDTQVGLVPYNGEFYYSDGGSGLGTARDELFKTDGTAAGTGLVKDLNPVSTGQPRQLTVANGLLFFTADGVDGNELWRSDGTAAGTFQVLDIRPGAFGSDPGDFSLLNDGTLLFSASPTGAGRGIGRTDGTPGGTTTVYDPPGFGAVQGLVGVGDEAWFFLGQFLAPTQLWRTDGTVGGESMFASGEWNQIESVASFGTGPLIVWESSNSGGGTTGVEPHVSSGTPAGTSIVCDINPGSSSSIAHGFTLAGTKVYFAANDGVHSTELHAIDVAEWGGWLAEPQGRGCGVVDAPALTFDGELLLGSTSSCFGLASAQPSTPALLYYSFGWTAAALGDCTLYLPSPTLFASGLTDLTGAFSHAMPVPSDPSLAGRFLGVQGALVVPGGPFVGVAELSDPLALVIGQ